MQYIILNFDIKMLNIVSTNSAWLSEKYGCNHISDSYLIEQQKIYKEMLEIQTSIEYQQDTFELLSDITIAVIQHVT